MPHVVLLGTVDPGKVAQSWTPLMERRDDGVLKVEQAYLALDGSALVAEALAIEGDNKQSFLVLVQAREDGIVVRLHPLIDPEKTDGVKRILALVALHVQKQILDLTVGKTNLEPFLAA